MSTEDKKQESFSEDVGLATRESDDFELLTEENRAAGERRLVRKLDMRLMPTVAVIYLMNYIDVSFPLKHIARVNSIRLFSALR